MNFSQALDAMKMGQRLARSGWNGRGMFVFYVAGADFVVNLQPMLSVVGEQVAYRPHIDMKDAEGKVGPWTPSQTDILADDWVVVEI